MRPALNRSRTSSRLETEFRGEFTIKSFELNSATRVKSCAANASSRRTRAASASAAFGCRAAAITSSVANFCIVVPRAPTPCLLLNPLQMVRFAFDEHRAIDLDHYGAVLFFSDQLEFNQAA